MNPAVSLRVRLTLIILFPILTIAVLAGFWQVQGARETADDVFDKSLLTAAVAVANDVAISGGDALSVRTRDILESTSGGRVFYHVYAPDGVIVAGYATPPVGIAKARDEAPDPLAFEARYLGRNVSGIRLQTRTEIDGFAGLYTTTVWQDSAVRAGLVRDLVLRSLIVLSSILLALVLIVWFGVAIGLRPILDLEQAIGRRSSDDLSPIRRAVPGEVSGLVGTLNRLFDQVSRVMSAQREFIGNAAHQLRNPIAGVLALAEAVVSAKTPQQAQERAGDLLHAARNAAELSQKLLMLERAQAMPHALPFERLDLGAALSHWGEEMRLSDPNGPRLSVHVPDRPVHVHADPVMLREAVANLVDNAVLHGGATMRKIDICLEEAGDTVVITVTDDGCGVPNEDTERMMSRFVQLGDGGTSGLGLAIVREIVDGHGGRVSVTALDPGLSVALYLSRLKE